MKNTKAELEKELTARVKMLKLHETILRRKINHLAADVLGSTLATFSDPHDGDDNVMGIVDEGLQDIRQAARDYVQCRLESRKWYDAKIRKGRKADGLTHKRIAGIDFIFPNI
jgi:hypothetical protein